MTAVRAGNKTEVARLLGLPDTEVNGPDKDGRTILHNLVSELVKLSDSEKASVFAAIDLLLAKGADINVTDKNGSSPLGDAVKLGDVKTVEFLLKNRANANTRDNDGKAPLHEFFQVSGPHIYQTHQPSGQSLTDRSRYCRNACPEWG